MGRGLSPSLQLPPLQEFRGTAWGANIPPVCVTVPGMSVGDRQGQPGRSSGSPGASPRTECMSISTQRYPARGFPRTQILQYMDSPKTRVFAAPTRGLAEPWPAGRRAKKSSSNTRTSSRESPSPRKIWGDPNLAGRHPHSQCWQSKVSSSDKTHKGLKGWEGDAGWPQGRSQLGSRKDSPP